MPYMIDPKAFKEHIKGMLNDAQADQQCKSCDHEELHQAKEYWDGWHECYNQIL